MDPVTIIIALIAIVLVLIMLTKKADIKLVLFGIGFILLYIALIMGKTILPGAAGGLPDSLHCADFGRGRRGLRDHPGHGDTTAAGDTFTGYFLTAITQNSDDPQAAIRRASAAAAIAVSKKGAAVSIPWADEVDAFLKEHTT